MDRHLCNMLKALRLANKGRLTVSPNPMVGCIIEKDGEIVGSGWHKAQGGPHAEVIALAEAKDNSIGATLYSTLEPCCHFGMTPPCVDSIIAAKIKKVYVSIIDPNPKVNGKGIERLKNEGIDVQVGLCQKEAENLNKIYLNYTRKKKPYVISKWAMSLDGKITRSSGSSGWISSEDSREHAHKIRQSIDAILIGSNTALIDNPLLTARIAGKPSIKQPVRIVLDSKGRLPVNLNIFNPKLPGKTIFATTNQCKKETADNLRKMGVEVLVLEKNKENKVSLTCLLDELAKLKITSLLVEGGAEIHTNFLAEDLVDEVCIYIAPQIIGSYDSLPVILQGTKKNFYFKSIKKIGSDLLLTANFV